MYLGCVSGGRHCCAQGLPALFRFLHRGVDKDPPMIDAYLCTNYITSTAGRDKRISHPRHPPLAPGYEFRTLAPGEDALACGDELWDRSHKSA